MNEASRWRFALAERVGRAYAADAKARVVMVAGSTGRGTADRYSDLDLDVYWSEPPTDAERRAAAMFAARGDLLSLYDVFCETEREILSVLLGLNHLYPPAPSLKQADELIAEMRLAPPDLARRLKEVFRLSPADGVAALHAVCEEVFALVETHLPGVDTAQPRVWLTRQRGVWDQPPPI